ncbi:peptidase domain-containing ABC transporter [Luteipulveratus sp. YIM 133132]|uniref:peptidase domain-containing ABC transporter n=1 Tax=Luteipulveratus flavus TaxID=3031728 RepID=UPI0023B16F1E|nr:peptidase domain-containing ABC transporter [Luteipulveratus sp. YIM 133132]MDE9364930.1 peptidase domain-containing ABC transporter [Luteipulveratus sp. YIM 133132]
MRKVPTTLQVTQTECGLCSARSVLAFHGQDLSITDLRAVIEPGRDGLSLKQIAELLRTQGMETSIYRVKDPRGLDVLEAPFVAHWRGYHFVVVERITASSAIVMDPMIGRTRITREAFEADFSGQALVARPTPSFAPARQPRLAAWRNKPIWPRSSGWTYVALAVLSLGVFGFTLAIPLLTERLVDRTARGSSSLPATIAMIALVAAGFIGVQILRTYVTTRLVRAVSWQLLTGAFEHLVRLPMKYFMSRPPGELVYRLNSLNQVRDILATKLLQGVLDALTALVLLGYIAWVAPPLGATAIGICAVVMLLLFLSQRTVKEIVDNEVHHNSRTQSVQLDAIVSMANLRIGGYSETYLEDWRDHLRQALAGMVRRMRIQQGWIGSSIAGVQAFAPLAILVVSLTWVRSGTITLGQAVSVQGVSALLFGLCSSVFTSYSDATVASRYLERADDIYAYEPEPLGGSRKALPHNGIDLQDVVFQYTDHSPRVLEAVSARIAPGAVVALVGESGSGKTTLGKILCSLYSPTEGTIRFGGVPMEEYDLSALRSHIGYIPQEGFLHNRSLAENLVLGTPVNEHEAIAFCRELPFMDFVAELPMGYHTVVSEMGANFSGGQRQRIAIAKALLRRPQLLVLDEATSALDNANQRRVHECIAELECTQIIIAHRLSTVLDADQIFVMEGGRIEDVGTHAELSVREGPYARLFGAERTREEVRG